MGKLSEGVGLCRSNEYYLEKEHILYSLPICTKNKRTWHIPTTRVGCQELLPRAKPSLTQCAWTKPSLMTLRVLFAHPNVTI